MQRSFRWSTIVILAILTAPLAGVFGVPAKPVRAEPLAPSALQDDEVILLTSAGQILVDAPLPSSGNASNIWSSGSSQGWMMVAAGDFNGDGDAEVVATKGNIFQVFDPVPQPGRPQVTYGPTSLGSNIGLVATGDFDGDKKAEIAMTFYDPISNSYRLAIADGGANAVAGDWQLSYPGSWGYAWQDMSAGDINNDGADDLVMVRNVDRRIIVFNGRTWGQLADAGGFATDWYAVATGNLTDTYSGDEIALERQGNDSPRKNSLIPMRVAPLPGQLGQLRDDIGGGAFYYPDFTSIATGDVNGDSVDEILMLRNPVSVGNTSLLMANPAGQTMFGFSPATGISPLFTIVRMGDVDGDGRAEVIIEGNDRYRIYYQPEISVSFTDYLGGFRTMGSVSNLPTIALANVDGVSGPTLGVTPSTLSFSVDYGAVSPFQPLTITNVGSGSSFQWKATVIEGSLWLLLDGQTGPVQRNTPGQVNVSVKTDAVDPGTYPGKIRVTTTDSNVANNTVDIPVTLVLRDPGFAAFPSALTIWQKIGGNPPPLTVTREVRIVRPVKATPWTATALSRDAAAVLMEKLAIGQATVTTAGPMIDGIMVPPPDWLEFTDDGTTPSTMTVNVRLGTTAGTYHGVIVIAAGDPSLPEGVSLVNVTAVVADHFNFTFLPLVTK